MKEFLPGSWAKRLKRNPKIVAKTNGIDKVPAVKAPVRTLTAPGGIVWANTPIPQRDPGIGGAVQFGKAVAPEKVILQARTADSRKLLVTVNKTLYFIFAKPEVFQLRDRHEGPNTLSGTLHSVQNDVWIFSEVSARRYCAWKYPALTGTSLSS